MFEDATDQELIVKIQENGMVDIGPVAEQIYEIVKDHPENCTCDDCVLFYVLACKMGAD